MSAGSLPWMLLASGKNIRNVVRAVKMNARLRNPLVLKYLRMACVLNYKEVHDMSELNELIPDWMKENIKLMVKDLGVRAVIDEIGAKAVIDEIGIDEVIKSVGIDELLNRVDARTLEQALNSRKSKAGKR